MKKIYLSIITLFFLAITLSVSGLAWFNISNISLIEGISLKAGAGDLLELSLDGINFSKNLDDAIIKEKLKKLKFKDITTQDGINFYKDPYLKETQKAEANIDFISLEVWFRVIPEINDEVEKHIFLANGKDVSYQEETNNGTYITSKGKSWKSDIDFNYSSTQIIKKGETKTYYAKDAMRIGINLDHKNQFIYDVSGNQERDYGKPFGAYDYYNKKNDEKLTLPNDVPENQIYELSSWDKEEAGLINHNNSYIMTLNHQGAYHIGKTTINIWLEGWDPDCLDAILNDHVMIQIEFITARKK